MSYKGIGTGGQGWTHSYPVPSQSHTIKDFNTWKAREREMCDQGSHSTLHPSHNDSLVGPTNRGQLHSRHDLGKANLSFQTW